MKEVSSNMGCSFATLTQDFQNRKPSQNRAALKNIKTKLNMTRMNMSGSFMREIAWKLFQMGCPCVVPTVLLPWIDMILLPQAPNRW
jgi:hypothetical protein